MFMNFAKCFRQLFCRKIDTFTQCLVSKVKGAGTQMLGGNYRGSWELLTPPPPQTGGQNLGIMCIF